MVHECAHVYLHVWYMCFRCVIACACVWAVCGSGGVYVCVQCVGLGGVWWWCVCAVCMVCGGGGIMCAVCGVVVVVCV